MTSSKAVEVWPSPHPKAVTPKSPGSSAALLLGLKVSLILQVEKLRLEGDRVTKH